MALRSKSYKKDWERIARPEPNKNFNVTEDVLAKGLAQIIIDKRIVLGNINQIFGLICIFIIVPTEIILH